MHLTFFGFLFPVLFFEERFLVFEVFDSLSSSATSGSTSDGVAEEIGEALEGS
jgi:hypothetical protein